MVNNSFIFFPTIHYWNPTPIETKSELPFPNPKVNPLVLLCEDETIELPSLCVEL